MSVREERESVAPESVQVVLKLELMNRMDGLVDLMGLRKPFRTQLARSRLLPASCHNLLKRGTV